MAATTHRVTDDCAESMSNMVIAKKTNNESASFNAHTYSFHTSILGVNHQIHDEATKVLRKNAFVVVSFEWPGLKESTHMFDVPIVTERKRLVARFANHSLRVHILHPDQEDLRRADKSSDYKVVTKLQLRSVSGKTLTPALEKLLLEPFGSMIIGRQKASAVGWRMLDIVQRLKQTGDELLLTGHEHLSAKKYQNLCCWFDCDVFDLADDAYDSDCGTPLGLVIGVMMAAATTSGFLFIRMGDMESASRMAAVINQMLAFHCKLPDHDHEIKPHG
ncbi:hypothetical protein LTR65_005302 [Meristemomyces frigidus]